MESESGSIELPLTPVQQEQVRQATGRSVESLILHPEELEDRIAPGMAYRPWQGLD